MKLSKTYMNLTGMILSEHEQDEFDHHIDQAVELIMAKAEYYRRDA